ncbi:unnamed protein product [Calypogeia fissa]
MHTLEPYIAETDIISLDFYIVSQFFAVDTVKLTQKEILEGIARVAHSWEKKGGSISRTRWIYNQPKLINQQHHLLNESLPLVIAFDTNLNKDLVFQWADCKGARLESRVVHSASAVKDEEKELAEMVASPPRKAMPLPVPENVPKRKLTNVVEPPAKKAKMDVQTPRAVSKVSTFDELAPTKGSMPKQTASRLTPKSKVATGPPSTVTQAPPKVTPARVSTEMKGKSPKIDDRPTPSKGKVQKTLDFVKRKINSKEEQVLVTADRVD